jgi:hypothetical protein
MARTFSFNKLIRWLAVLSILQVSTMPAWTTPSAQAAPNSMPPLRQELWVPDGPVYNAVISGNTLYIGGGFTRLGPPTGGWVGLQADTGDRRTELPRVAGSVSVMTSDGSGGWYIGGDFTAVDGTPRSNLAHIQADGTLDRAWSVDTDAGVYSMILNGNLLYIGGDFSSVKGEWRSCVAAINIVTGTLSSWAPSIWRSGGVASVYALEVSGNIVYVGGYFDQAGGQARNNLAALDSGSGNVQVWDPSPNSSVSTLALYGTTLYVGGQFWQIGGASRNYLAAVDTTTGNATTWDPNVSGGGMFPSISVLYRDGDLLYIGGQFSQIGGFARNCLAALDLTTETITSWDPNVTESSWNSRVTSLVRNNNTVYAGGNFTQVGGQPRNFLAAIDATTGAATAWNPDPNYAVWALATAGTTVYAGGGFTSFNGEARNHLAALDLLTGEPTAWDPNVNGTAVRAMALYSNTLYIGGLFSQVGGQTRNNAAAVDITSGEVNGWNPDSNNWVEALATNGVVVFAGGAFVTIGGQDRFNLAALDPTTGAATAWNAEPNGPSVYCLQIVGSTLLVGGDFTTLTGANRNNAGAVNVDTGAILDWNPDVTHESGYPTVWDILLNDDGNVYLAGYFDHVGGQGRNNLAAVNASDGTPISWNPDLGGYVGPYSEPAAYTLMARGKTLFVGGLFSQVGGQDRRNLAALDIITGMTTAWDPEAHSSVSVLAGDGGTIYAGGSFLAVADQPQAYIAGIAAVTAQTDPATNVNETSATLNGIVTAYADPGTLAAFEWGTTSGGPYPNELAASPSPVASTDPVSVSATLLNPTSGVRYYYRVRATTSGGSIVYGTERSFNLTVHVYLPLVKR